MCWEGWSNRFFFFLKQPFLNWVCLQIQESATDDDLISICYLKKKKVYFIPDSQGVIAKELALVRPLQTHPALWYGNEIPLHCCYYCICASVECVFIGIGILVLIFESGIECWSWVSLCFSLYTQFLSYLVLKEVKGVCLDLPNRQAAEFFLFVLVVTVKDLYFKVILFLRVRGQGHCEGFVACKWLMKASLASWSKLPFRSGWMWKKTSEIN